MSLSPSRPQRVAKMIAQAGLCSRREAEKWIMNGRVSLDGKVLTVPSTKVDDPLRLTVDSRPLPAVESVRLWRYHKAKGFLTTHHDPLGRPTVFEALPFDSRHIISVGRLDLYSEGLLLLTNQGKLSRYLEHPSTGLERRYLVQIQGRPCQIELNKLENGITIEGIHYQKIEAKIEKRQGFRYWVSFILREGKNREIRKIVESFGWKVTRLIRESYGPFQLADLKPGEIQEVSPLVVNCYVQLLEQQKC